MIFKNPANLQDFSIFIRMKTNVKRLYKLLRTQPVPINTREILALERTKLANERTLLAYIRASLYLLIGGLALLQLKDFANIQWVGYLALGVCILFLAIGIFRFIFLKRKLYKWNKVLFAETIQTNVDNTAEELKNQ